jgi:hypothetical protein
MGSIGIYLYKYVLMFVSSHLPKENKIVANVFPYAEIMYNYATLRACGKNILIIDTYT